jgi:hypothetical protein
MKGEKAVGVKESQIEYDGGHEGKFQVGRSFLQTDLAGLSADWGSVGAIPVAAANHETTEG